MRVFHELLRGLENALAMPIAVHPGIELTGGTVRELVTSAEAQTAAAVALTRKLGNPVVMSAMDLSVESEAFGCQIHMSEHEIPTVTSALVAGLAEVESLAVPEVGVGRTGVYLETVSRLRREGVGRVVLGGCIGPFSLASRLVGMTEALGLTIMDPGLMHVVLEKATAFLEAYVRAFREAGADGVIMAEPGAGLLSPKSMAEFSSAYVRRVHERVCDDRCGLILHNCAAKLVHLPAVLESGVRVYHFGAPMDVAGALGKVGPEVVVCGNLDPTQVFLQGTPGSVRERAQALLRAAGGRRNFVVSSGCDVPPGTPVANLEALFEVARATRLST